MADEMNVDISTEDVAGDEFEDTEIDAGETADDVVTGSDPWNWAEGQDPEKIRNTWEKFTNKWQEVLDKEKEVGEYMDVINDIKGNAELQQLLRNFYQNGPSEDLKIDSLREEINQVKNEITIEKELVDLNKYVAGESLPEFDQRKLLEHAAKNGFPNLNAAYKDLYFDDIRRMSEDGAYDNIKKNRKAAVPKIGAGERRSKQSFTESDLASMSDEDFIKNYSDIARSMSKGL